MLRLTAECGPDAGRVFLTRNIYAVVGRNGEIAPHDRTVSDYHALIQIQENGTILVTDLNSETGTWLGYGERTAEQLKLKSGMCFKVGNTVLRLHLEQTAPLLPPARTMPLPTAAASAPAPVAAAPANAAPVRPHVLHVAKSTRPGGTAPLTPPATAPATRSTTPQPAPVTSRSTASSSSASLELEFDPDILAVADNETQNQGVEMREPQRLVIPAPARREPATVSSRRSPSIPPPIPQSQPRWAGR